MQVEIPSVATLLRGELELPSEAPRPGVVVVHDGRGFGPHVIDVAKNLADKGYAALAIDLYTRGGPAPDASVEDLSQFIGSVSDVQVVEDLQVAIDYLRHHPDVLGDAIGMVGYCWGGLFTFLAAAHCQGLSASVSWYGALRWDASTKHHLEHPIDALSRATCPVLGLFAEEDIHVPIADVRDLESRIRNGERDIDVVVYSGAQHGFAHPLRADVFDADAYKDGWRRLERHFSRHLRGQPDAT